MGKVKIVYKDLTKIDGVITPCPKIIFGDIIEEDNIFVKIRADNGTEFRINKTDITSIKESNEELRDYDANKQNY